MNCSTFANSHNPEDSKPPGHHTDISEPDAQFTASYPDELVVRLAHLAGLMEARGQIELHDWDSLCQAIQQIITAYDQDRFENFNPTCIEDAAERWFTSQFGTDNNKEPLEKTSPTICSPEHLISMSKRNFKPLSTMITTAAGKSHSPSTTPPSEKQIR